jgi:hypothetical protein
LPEPPSLPLSRSMPRSRSRFLARFSGRSRRRVSRSPWTGRCGRTSLMVSHRRGRPHDRFRNPAWLAWRRE